MALQSTASYLPALFSCELSTDSDQSKRRMSLAQRCDDVQYHVDAFPPHSTPNVEDLRAVDVGGAKVSGRDFVSSRVRPRCAGRVQPVRHDRDARRFENLRSEQGISRRVTSAHNLPCKHESGEKTFSEQLADDRLPFGARQDSGKGVDVMAHHQRAIRR